MREGEGKKASHEGVDVRQEMTGCGSWDAQDDDETTQWD
jgi:hypothetical protein